MPLPFSRFILPGAMLALAACSSSSSSGIVPLASAASSQSVSFGKSNPQILYVTDSGTNEVETFAWPKPSSPTGTLTGFSEPQGACADRSDDVFIANTGVSNVLEYKGTQQSATLADPNQYPVDCAYDTRNGDLAVTNVIATNDGPGSISLYRHAKGSPKTISVNGLERVAFDAYDPSGDLYADGETSASQAEILELPAGSKTFRPFCPNLFGGGAFTFPGGLAWDGKYLVVGTSQGLERIKNCKVVGKIIAVPGYVEFAIAGNRVVAPDAGNADVNIYSYPQGKHLQTLSGFSEPTGVAISENGQ